MSVIGKIAYVGHRRFLPTKHHLWSNLNFIGKTDRRPHPRRLSSVDVLQQLIHVKNSLSGKHHMYGVK